MLQASKKVCFVCHTLEAIVSRRQLKRSQGTHANFFQIHINPQVSRLAFSVWTWWSPHQLPPHLHIFATPVWELQPDEKCFNLFHSCSDIFSPARFNGKNFALVLYRDSRSIMQDDHFFLLNSTLNSTPGGMARVPQVSQEAACDNQARWVKWSCPKSILSVAGISLILPLPRHCSIIAFIN